MRTGIEHNPQTNPSQTCKNSRTYGTQNSQKNKNTDHKEIRVIATKLHQQHISSHPHQQLNEPRVISESALSHHHRLFFYSSLPHRLYKHPRRFFSRAKGPSRIRTRSSLRLFLRLFLLLLLYYHYFFPPQRYQNEDDENSTQHPPQQQQENVTAKM